MFVVSPSDRPVFQCEAGRLSHPQYETATLFIGMILRSAGRLKPIVKTAVKMDLQMDQR